MADLHLTKPPAKGPAVRKLQKQLTAVGFDTGGIDGEFGKQTDAAVRAFQTSQGLTADGVAGADTIAALKAARATGSSAASGTTGALDAGQIAAVIGCESVQRKPSSAS